MRRRDSSPVAVLSALVFLLDTERAAGSKRLSTEDPFAFQSSSAGSTGRTVGIVHLFLYPSRSIFPSDCVAPASFCSILVAPAFPRPVLLATATFALIQQSIRFDPRLRFPPGVPTLANSSQLHDTAGRSPVCLSQLPPLPRRQAHRAIYIRMVYISAI